jgi:MFS family permease
VTQARNASGAVGGTSAFEWWYVAHFAFGVIHSGFIAILVPTYIIAINGKAADVGFVIFSYGLGALLAPAMGSLADRYRAYRAAQLAGLASYVLGALVFASSADRLLLAVAAGVLGIGSSILQMIDPAFILGAGFQRQAEARRLTRLSQTERVGQLLGGLAVAVLIQARLPFSVCFAIMAGAAAACLLLTAVTNRNAAARIKYTEPDVVKPTGVGKVPLRSLLAPSFGLFLLAAMCARAGLDMLYGQYPNYMQHVFQISPALSATALSVGAVVTLLVIDLVGRWMGRSGPATVWLAVLSIPIVIAGALVLLAALGPVPAYIPLAMYVILRLCVSWANLTQPPLAHGLSKAPLGTTQGILWGGLVIGFMVANMVGGWLADAFGFESIPWAIVGLSVLAVLLGSRAVNRSRTEQPDEGLLPPRRPRIDRSATDEVVA